MTRRRPHRTDDPASCWCDPLPARPCSQCEGDDPSCWLCRGTGLVECRKDEATTVIHRDGDD